MVGKIRDEGEKWVRKQGEGIFIYLFLSPPFKLLPGKKTGIQSLICLCLIADGSFTRANFILVFCLLLAPWVSVFTCRKGDQTLDINLPLFNR